MSREHIGASGAWFILNEVFIAFFIFWNDKVLTMSLKQTFQ